MDRLETNPNQKLAIAIKDFQEEVIEDGATEKVSIPGISRRDILIGIIVDTLLDDFGIEISHTTAELRVRETFQKMMRENLKNEYNDPVSRFRKEWPEVSESKSLSKFTILIPLPIANHDNVLPGKIEFNGHALNRVGPGPWKKFEHQARTTEAQDTHGYPPNLNEFIEGTDLQSVTSSEYTFWRFNKEGIDIDYIVQQMKSVLNVLLGQLCFVADNQIPTAMDHSLNKVQTRTRTVFRLPPFYLIFQDSIFHRIHPDTYPVQKPIPRIRNDFNFSDIMNAFPSLGTFSEGKNSIYRDNPSVHVRPVEATLGASFRTLGQALRETDPELMFLWLYRTLEHITFTKYSKSKEPLIRALRLLNINPDQQLTRFVDVVKDRRNTIVHDGIDVQITQTEINLLKSLSISAIRQVGKISQDNGTDEIVSLLITDDLSSKIRTLQRKEREVTDQLSSLQDKLEVFEDIQEWTREN
ncbi:hypothetical protein [Halalkalicoccus sp. NIPERK01]|uniref:hypothetical protein n=1 Tax=Halalkalicoccus sp. NIPERK01 TaxID=3053469 RepID=UPI00256F2DA3|nr:hypothetical protein [Halalkalicoccus sp. NIPERK01]MDL5363793.1 hypothetical protein [Halalkalicoccus sp. NIPERK01]